ncbi:hypothetical protein [Hymenobacter sp.]|uniref:hypothetical protein n=1 Tax=Hymenobacter sp. TaxID=1898978 RepID=UPI002ED8CDE9
MTNVHKIILLVNLVSISAQNSFAQAKVYLDAGIGFGYNYAEGGHFGWANEPFIKRQFILHNFLNIQPRVQLNKKFSFALGYRGSGLSWGYKIKVPDNITVNASKKGDKQGHANSAYLHQFPLMLNYLVKRYNIRALDTLDKAYLLSFKLDVFLGGGLNLIGNNCLNCGNFNSTTITGQTNPARDIIEFRQQPYYNHKWGSFLTIGVMAHFYRLGKERLNLSFAITQGFTDMILVPVQYSYNGNLGAAKMHVRGSGISATLGYPILISTFNKR